MGNRIIKILMALLVAVLTSCESKEVQKDQGVAKIARAVSEMVGVIGNVSNGTKDTPIIILEENHDSRAGQIQHAIILNRLYEQYKMKDIILEGYLKEIPAIDTQWFDTACSGLSKSSKAGIAICLLKEGEISEAEFMKLIYNDIVLHPSETKIEYEIKLDPKIVNQAINSYLGKIAEKSDKDREWVQKKVAILNDVEDIKTRPMEQNLAIVESVKRRAENLSIQFDSSDQQAMETYLGFLRARANATRTIYESTIKVASQQNIPIIAVVIGAAHREKLCGLLRAANSSFAVIRPLSLDKSENKGDLPWDMFIRKYDKVSVHSTGLFTDTLLKNFPNNKNKKPQPVLDEEWFQIKASLYANIKKIVDKLGSGNEPPIGGGKPPFGLSSDDFKFKDKMLINIDKIEIRYNDEKKRKGRALVFPVEFYPNDKERKNEIWIKASPGITEESLDIETLLKNALKEVQEETELTSKLDDCIQISTHTAAAIKPTREEAVKAVVTVI